MDEMNRFLNQTCHFGEGSHHQRKTTKPQFHLDLSKVVSTEQLIQEGKGAANWKTKYLSDAAPATKYDCAEVLRRSQLKRGKSRPPSEKPIRVAFEAPQRRVDFNFREVMSRV